MKKYKYTDSTNTVVHIIDEDGKTRASCVSEILEPGTAILPADPPTSDHIITTLALEVQSVLDNKVKERGYDGILSAASYAVSKHPTFSIEGRACVDWRDAVWDVCYKVMEEVMVGTRPTPSVEELIALLPKLTWPI